MEIVNISEDNCAIVRLDPTDAMLLYRACWEAQDTRFGPKQEQRTEMYVALANTFELLAYSINAAESPRRVESFAEWRRGWAAKYLLDYFATLDERIARDLTTREEGGDEASA